MIGFACLMAHLIGDYIFQDDYQAKNKTNPWPGRRPDHRTASGQDSIDWLQRRRAWWLGHLACTVHCALYTLSCFMCCHLFFHGFGYYAVIFGTHWFIDRFRFARWWMTHVTSQKDFATGPLSPWSIILVDNIMHLWVLFILAWHAEGGGIFNG